MSVYACCSVCSVALLALSKSEGARDQTEQGASGSRLLQSALWRGRVLAESLEQDS